MIERDPALLRAGFLAHGHTAAYKRRIEAAQSNVHVALQSCRRPYIAFSTGKDSTVMADMVWRESPSTPAVYFDADACFPESRALLERYRSSGRTIIEWPTEPILDTMERVGGPTSPRSEAATMQSTVYAPIKALLETHAFDCAFVGLRAEENTDRKRAIRIHGPMFYSQRDDIQVAWPIGALTFDDIWAYIFSQGVDYSAVYDRQFEMGLPWDDCRLSYCYGETKASHGRWAILRRGWPDLFARFAARFPEVRRFT